MSPEEGARHLSLPLLPRWPSPCRDPATDTELGSDESGHRSVAIGMVDGRQNTIAHSRCAVVPCIGSAASHRPLELPSIRRNGADMPGVVGSLGHLVDDGLLASDDAAEPEALVIEGGMP